MPKIAVRRKQWKIGIAAPFAMETMTYFDVNLIENQAAHHYQQLQTKYNVMWLK